MFKFDDVIIKEFSINDIQLKVNWVNDTSNNTFLHYNNKITFDSTLEWFKNRNLEKRWDGTVFYKDIPVGLFGLINIDYDNFSCEDYSMIGENEYKGKGIGYKAGVINVCHAFYELGLNKVWGTIEVGNIASLKRWRKMGGIVEGYLHDYYFKNNSFNDAYYVGICKKNFNIPKGIEKI